MTPHRTAGSIAACLRALLLGLAFLLLSTDFLRAQCPAIGQDSTCDTVITITNTGTSISYTGQPGYSGGQAGAGPESLVGVINDSSQPLSQLGLSSTLPIFAFCGGGIDNYGVPGNAADDTGYGGPNAYFTNIDPMQSNGIVNFLNPIAAYGGTSFFSLPALLSQATSCSDVLANSITVPASGGTQITSVFTPNLGYTLAQAAPICGFDSFDWQQTITNLPAPSPYYTADTFENLTAPLAFNDPPPAGYSYQLPNANAVGLSIYYNLGNGPPELAVTSYETTNMLSFYDSPADPCLPGGDSSYCGYVSAPAGSYLGFATQLVGIIGTYPFAYVQPTGIGFSYIDTFNGTSGGIAVTNSVAPVDPNSGSGGATITRFNGKPSYQFPKSFAVSSVNGQPAPPNVRLSLLTPGQVSVTTSGLAYSRVTKTFNGTLTIKNVSNQAIDGPLQVLLLALPNNVSLTAVTGLFGGSPFLTVPGISGLSPGASVTVKLQFNNPSSTVIKFSPAIYIGGFN
jgi:hypothetical protein